MAKPTVIETTIVHEDCYTCGIPVAMTPLQSEHFRNKGGSYYCVLGHQTCFKKPENQRLKEELSRAQEQLNRKGTEVLNLKHLLEVTEQKSAKARKRADKGICQHCKRSFKDVQQHVQSKHPEVLA